MKVLEEIKVSVYENVYSKKPRVIDRMNAHNNDFKERHDSGLF